MGAVVSVIICFFAAYGVIQMILKFTAYMYTDEHDLGRRAYTVLTTKNQQDSIEGMVRAAVWKALASSGSSMVNDVVVIDLGSEDETYDILLRLANEYEFLHVMSKDAYIEQVESLS